MGFLDSIFGGAPKAAPQTQELDEAEDKTRKKSRVALFGTKGGASGEEVGQGMTSRRGNIFGN